LEFLSKARTPTRQTRNTAADNRYKNKNTSSKQSPEVVLSPEHSNAPTVLESCKPLGFLSSAHTPTRPTRNTDNHCKNKNINPKKSSEAVLDSESSGDSNGSECFDDEDGEDAPLQHKQPEAQLSSPIPLRQPSNKSVFQHESKVDKQPIAWEPLPQPSNKSVIALEHRRRIKAKAPQRLPLLTSHEACKNTESATAPEFESSDNERIDRLGKRDGIERRIIDVSSSTIVPRDGETTGPVTSLHLEEDSDVSGIQVGLDSLSIVAEKKEVVVLINELEAKTKAAADSKNNNARILAEKKTLADTLRQEVEEKEKGLKTRATRRLIREKRLALIEANEDVDSLSAVDDAAARIEGSKVEKKLACLTNQLEELNRQEEALKKSDDAVPSKEKAESTALLPASYDFRVDAGKLSYSMEFKEDYIYRHNLAYLKCKNNHNGGPVTFFIPMNVAFASADAEEFDPLNYTIIGHQYFESLLKTKRVSTIGTTALYFSKDDLDSKVTISGGEGVANIVHSFHSKRDNAVVHLIDRVLEEDETEITDAKSLTSNCSSIATGTTFGYCSASQIIGSPFVLPKKNMSNLLTAAAAKTEDSRDNMSYISTGSRELEELCEGMSVVSMLSQPKQHAANTEDNRDNMLYGSTNYANNVLVPVTGSPSLEELNEAMSIATLQETKGDYMSVLSKSKQHETLPDGGGSTNHQQPHQQAIVRRLRNEQEEGKPAGFNHQQGAANFSIGHDGGGLEWAKRCLNLNPDRSYSHQAMKQAYKDRLFKTHPDKNNHVLKVDRERFEEEFRNVRTAWRILNRVNDNKVNRPITTTTRAFYGTNTKYANDLKKNLDRFMTLGTFLPELNKLTLLRYAASTEKLPFQLSASQLDLEEPPIQLNAFPPFQLNAFQLDLYRLSNLSKQREVLEAGLAKVEMRAPVQVVDGSEICDLQGAIHWKNVEIIGIKKSIKKLRGNERLAITDPTTRVAFTMQSQYEKQPSSPLLLSGEEDQAEAVALIGQGEAAALIVAAESTNPKRKADSLAQHDNDTSEIAPSAGKKKRRRRDNLEINMNNTDEGKNYTRTRSGRRSSPN